ncbi:adhesion G-protein coupled receptor F1 [Symphorus nematophorus]
MHSRVFMFVIGTLYISYQVFASELFIAELMVESNVTLEAQILQAVLNKTILQVKADGTTHNVELLENELVAVRINGSITLKKGSWDSTKSTKLNTAIEGLNGFENLNVTSTSGNTTAFEAAVSVKFDTPKLQAIVSKLETDLEAILKVDTVGFVTIESPETAVCYKSSPQLKCTLKEKAGIAGWNMSRKHERFELNNGSVVKLNRSLSSADNLSWVTVTLQGVTGIWAGTYECGFTEGSVRHTAKTKLSVALLPDEINLKISPLTVDCSEKKNVSVTATILNSPENFEVSWSYMKQKKANLQNKYGAKFCAEEEINGEMWPKTPNGDTVINRTCPEGRAGYKSRTCHNTVWEQVFSYCVNNELNKVSSAADKFLLGLGATQDVAMDIFNGITNSSTPDSGSESDETMADISASVNILNVMAKASDNVVLEEGILPSLVNAASNMLNKTWAGVNESVIQNVSSSYLLSVEDLVKNIKINRSHELNSQNLELKFCSGSDCEVSVFDVEVTLNQSSGTVKTVAVKNLMDKLNNNFDGSKMIRTSLVISATVENNHDSQLEITLAFPRGQQNVTEPHCVFWNTTENGWSDEGCHVKTGDGNHTTCVCNHLTSFSVLMSKSDVSDKVLDMITVVGLGVSVCSLLIFLIIESLVWSAVVKTNLSHFRHTALVNIAVFLMLADCSFLASTNAKNLSDNWCLVLTMSKHLFYLAMFSWMLCMSVMLVHQLIFVFSPLRKRVFMFFSSIIGYVCPILIVGSSYVYCKYTNSQYFNRKTCWLVFDRLLEGSIHAFVLPVGTVILTNLFSMVVVILTLVKSSVPDGSKTDEKETAKSILKVVVFLTPVFGVTWIIGFAMLMLEEKSQMHKIASYAFTILNSFQGLFILITGVFAEQKVREEMIKLIMAKSKGKSDSTKNLTSTMYTKDK